MIRSISITLVSALSLLAFVLLFSLLISGMERVWREKRELVYAFDLAGRFLTGRCFGHCPPVKLTAACFCLLLAFLFISMGTLPQFISTYGDVVCVIFLFALSQSFFIRGMRSFSEDIYQTLDKHELYALSRFITAYIIVGGTVAWYLLSRGIPGSIFSFDALTATPLWSVMGIYGRAGIFFFFVLLTVNSPSRHSESVAVYYNIPLPEVFDALRSTLCPAIVTAAFIAWTPARALGLYGWKMYAVGFASFWFEVMLIQIFVFPVIWKYYQKIKSLLPEKYNHAVMVVMAFAGVCCFLIDLYS